MESFSLYVSLTLWGVATTMVLVAIILGHVTTFLVGMVLAMVALYYYRYHCERFGELVLFVDQAPASSIQFLDAADKALHPAAQATCYHRDAPAALVTLLERLQRTCTPVRIYYGDPATGESWRTEAGYVSRSEGAVRYPMLSAYKHQPGRPIQDHRIVRIEDLIANEVLYRCAALAPKPPARNPSTEALPIHAA